jgi:hypothetical protein
MVVKFTNEHELARAFFGPNEQRRGLRTSCVPVSAQGLDSKTEVTELETQRYPEVLKTTGVVCPKTHSGPRARQSGFSATHTVEMPNRSLSPTTSWVASLAPHCNHQPNAGVEKDIRAYALLSTISGVRGRSQRYALL